MTVSNNKKNCISFNFQSFKSRFKKELNTVYQHFLVMLSFIFKWYLSMFSTYPVIYFHPPPWCGSPNTPSICPWSWLCQIFEPIVAPDSKIMPTSGLDLCLSRTLSESHHPNISSLSVFSTALSVVHGSKSWLLQKHNLHMLAFKLSNLKHSFSPKWSALLQNVTAAGV